VLDNSQGRPASGVDATLEFRTQAGWEVRGSGTTGEDGRIDSLLFEDTPVKGTYRVTFNTGAYFRRMGQESFFPEVLIVFDVAQPEEHYHIPLLLSPFGYTTYRGG
jgi:5-hydroxyisourate hydrolase